MSGLNHRFLLLSRNDYRFEEYARFINDPRSILLHDDFLQYTVDTLRWIETFNPATGKPHRGLCMHGPTVIHTRGAQRIAAIFESWANLISNGPEQLVLTGAWTTNVDSTDSGYYEPLHLGRDDLTGKLRRIAAYASRVVESAGELFILHSGV